MRSQSSGHTEKQISKMLKKTNYYEMLELKSNASDAQIKKSYKKLALKYHPDKNSAESSKQVFHKISQAYDTLSDPSKRNVYDERNNLMNSFEQNYKSKPFFNSQPFSNFSNWQKQQSYFQKKFSEKYKQNKMDQKARKQRQQMKKQYQFKENNENFNKFYKHNSSANKAGTSFNKQNAASSQNKDKKENQGQRQKSQKFSNAQFEQAFKKYQKFCQSKSEFGKRTSNRPSFQQYKSEIQKKLRFQRQKQQAESRIRKFKMVVFLILVYLFFSYFGPSLKGPPVYSMHPSKIHKIPHFTKELNSPFYVTEQYLERANSDDKFRDFLDKKIDLIYIKTLSRVCNTIIQKEEELQAKLNNVKSKRSRQKIESQLQGLDLSSCDKLHQTRQRNPQYFRKLFQNQNPTSEQLL